jgi:DNA polymerase II large subunit
MNTQEYFKKLEEDVKEVYEIAEKARIQGLDPVDKVEIPLARSLAEKVVGLISTIYPQLTGSGIEDEIIKAEKEWGKLNTAVAFKIAEQIARQEFCKFSSLLEAIDAGIRVGFSYVTLGVVASPIEGYTKLELGKTKDGKEYFKAFFSGPIRSAGTTATCVALMLINHLREVFGFAKYDPTEEEIKRYWVENYDYHSRVTNLQYMPTEEEVLFLAKNLPIQIDGDRTEKREVSNHKNLERVDSNFIRGGMCLTFSEGLAQKAKKGMRLLKGVKEKGFESTGWDFLNDYIKLHEERDKGKKAESPTYINDLVAGRPIFGHPSKSGGFRFRYGRARNSGFSGNAVHPATMTISDGFIANGTQLKIEKPTKGCIVTSCDSIDGPIVKLSNGSVRKLDDFREAKKLYSDVEEIIYLGDFLVPFSDVANRNYNLIKAGYVEEWWGLDLREKDEEFSKEVDFLDVSFEKAVEISKKYNVPLYPKFIYYWTEISKEQFSELINWLKEARINKKIILPFNKSDRERFEVAKRALELLGIEHEVSIENVIIDNVGGKALFANLGLDYNLIDGEEVSFENVISPTSYKLEEEKSVLDSINDFSEFEIKDKAGTFVGSRMGRPEKAKLRKLTGSPNVLFPVGKEGGRLRSIQEACNVGKVKSSFPLFYCESCENETIYLVCESCGSKCKQMYYSPELGEKVFNVEEKHGKVLSYAYKALDINHYLDKSREKIGLAKSQMPILIKGVRGLSSSGKQTENLAKGILRAKYNLQVNKEGTIRFDGTEIPLVSFKPKEISVSIGKLKEIGYNEDIHGKELIDEDQILELKPHDIILPCVKETHEETADDVFIQVCHFVDDLLRDFYKLDSYHNIDEKEDLVGQLGVFMAPHNCAGVICRFIGFSNNLGILASPYMHAAVRRDCDGDEAAVMLLSDVLLNFSRAFLPSHRGGTQDAPLVLNAKIDAGEVDDQILDFELVNEYPLELYRLSEEGGHHSSEIKINTVELAMKNNENPFVNMGFTHNTDNFNDGVSCSTYKTLPTMREKVEHQMILVEKIRAADTSDTARLIIEKHFIRDMKGNLRSFSTQSFRCVGCNEIVRRPPLKGKCPKCGGKLIFTIHEGGIKKYLNFALELTEKYNLSLYLQQNIQLIKRYIDSIFGKELEKQEKLEQWF